VSEETTLPMMYINDAIKGTIDIMEAHFDKINVRNSYNISAFSFSAKELENELQKYIPHLQVTYKPDKRDLIANSWPKSINDIEARNDWGWSYEYDLSRMTRDMVENLRREFGLI
jgi:nucleoside-diphosphate-sugar epimerase